MLLLEVKFDFSRNSSYNYTVSQKLAWFSYCWIAFVVQTFTIIAFQAIDPSSTLGKRIDSELKISSLE